MNMAIDEAVLSMNEHLEPGIPPIFIGAVLVDSSNKILGKAHKIEDGHKRIHSEYQLLVNLPDKDNSSLTLYTTLEPCNFRHKSNNEQQACTELIVSKRIGSVVIAMLDSHPNINGKAVEYLVNAGVDVKVLDGNNEYKPLVDRLIKMNSEFINFKW